MAPIKAIGYIRVSRVGDRAGDTFISPDLQRQSIERVCAREGLTLIDTYEELDASGGDSSRPLWNLAIERIEKGEAQALVTWNLSRFSRSTKDALSALDRIESAGGTLYSEEGNLGKLSRTILFAVAEDERDRAKAGFYNAQANAIERGIWMAARIPFGYLKNPETRRLEPDPETVPVVKELFSRRINGTSWTELAKFAAEAHPRAPQTRRGLKDMLSNPVYLGVARGVGGLRNEAAHEPLISKRDFDKAAKRERSVRTGSLTAKSLMQGVLRCATCKSVMQTGWTRGKGDIKHLGYYCRSEHCDDHAYIRLDVLDEWIEADLLHRFDMSKARINIPQDDSALAAAEKALADAQYDLDTWIDNIEGLSIMGKERWNEKAADLTTIRNVAAKQVEELRAAENPGLLNLAEVWKDWGLRERREFIDKFFESVLLTPAHRRKLPVQERVMMIAKTDFEGLETD